MLRNNNKWTWDVEINDMSHEFLSCFRFSETYHRHYEDNSMNISLEWEPNSLQFEVNKTKDMMHIMIMDFEKDDAVSSSKTGIQVNLTCKVQDKIYPEKEFVFNQPIVLQYDLEGLNMGTISAVTTVVICVVLGLTIALICYHKNHTKRPKILTLEKNPNYDTFRFDGTTDDDAFLPYWLREKNEMIYDTSCIEKGRRLGHGNFGTVFEGKIRLGNAV